MTTTVSTTAGPARTAYDHAPVSALRVFGALLRRDLMVARREIVSFLVRTTLQPLLGVVVFGFLLPKMGFVSDNYTAALLPGIVAISLAFASLQAVALPMITDFGFTREIEDRLLAPAPIRMIALEKMVSGMLQGTLSALFVLPLARIIMGPIAGLSWGNFGEVVGMALLGSAAFSAFGLWMGTAIPAQQIGLMFSVIVAPMIFFGCVYYPWASLHAVPAMQIGVLINPIVYVSEALRGTLTPSLPHMPIVVTLVALIVVTALIGWAGMKSFTRRAMS